MILLTYWQTGFNLYVEAVIVTLSFFSAEHLKFEKGAHPPTRTKNSDVVVHFAAGRGAKYCGERVCMSVGPIANLKGHYFQPSLSVSLSVCLYVCVSLTGTSTLQH